MKETKTPDFKDFQLDFETLSTTITGEQLKEFRAQRKLSQQDLADLLRCSRRTVFNWESGGKIIPETSQLLLLLIKDIDEAYSHLLKISKAPVVEDEDDISEKDDKIVISPHQVGEWFNSTFDKPKPDSHWIAQQLFDSGKTPTAFIRTLRIFRYRVQLCHMCAHGGWVNVDIINSCSIKSVRFTRRNEKRHHKTIHACPDFLAHQDCVKRLGNVLEYLEWH